MGVIGLGVGAAKIHGLNRVRQVKFTVLSSCHNVWLSVILVFWNGLTILVRPEIFLAHSHDIEAPNDDAIRTSRVVLGFPFIRCHELLKRFLGGVSRFVRIFSRWLGIWTPCPAVEVQEQTRWVEVLVLLLQAFLIGEAQGGRRRVACAASDIALIVYWRKRAKMTGLVVSGLLWRALCAVSASSTCSEVYNSKSWGRDHRGYFQRIVD